MGEAPISTLRLFAYGLLGLPLAAATLPVYLFVPTFYAEELGLGMAGVGAVLFGARLVDVASDPVVGWLSDRTGSRLGRRIPWIACGVPAMAVGIWLLFRPGTEASLSGLAVGSIVLYLGWTCVTVPYTAWGAEASAYYHQRSRLAAWREGCVVIGTLLAAGLVAAGSSLGEGLGWLAIGTLALLVLATPVLVLLGPRPDRMVRLATGSGGGFDPRRGVRLLLANRPFRRLLSAWFLNGVANGLPATLFLLFVTYRLDAAAHASWLLLTYFGVSIVGLPVWIWAARRWDKHRVWCVAMVWACGWFALAPFLGSGDIALYVALVVGTGLALGADLVLPPAMQADAVDVETAETGTARTATYFALWGMATKLSLALAVGIAFPVLDWAGGPSQGGWMLGLLYGGVPIAFKIAALLLIRRFEIGREAQERLRHRIDRHGDAVPQPNPG